MAKLSPEVKAWQYYMEKPEAQIRDIQGVDSLEGFQIKKIVRAVAKHNKVVVKSCHAMGKTFTAAKIVCWFVPTFPYSIVITTAPTFNQVRLLLWQEIRRGHAQSKFPLGGKMLQTEWHIDDGWYAIGLTTKIDAGNEEGQGASSSFQGFHAKYILVIFDEAVGIHLKVWKMVKGLLTSGAVVKFLGIGNPTTRACEFFECFNNFTYHHESITCFDSPNLQANGFNSLADIKKELKILKKLSKEETLGRIESYKVVNYVLLKAQWVIELAIEVGVEHPLFVSKALGEFPEEDEYTLLKFSAIQAAAIREPDRSEGILRVGGDPAWKGKDKSALCIMEGWHVLDLETHVKLDGIQLADEVVKLIRKHGWKKAEIAIDSTGVGASCLHQLRAKLMRNELPEGTKLFEVHFSNSADNEVETKSDKAKKEAKRIKKRYANLKAKGFDHLSDDLENHISLVPRNDESEKGISIAGLQKLEKQMPTVRFGHDAKEKMYIESKDDYKVRTGKESPDETDAVMLANLTRHLKDRTVGTFQAPTTTTGTGETIAGALDGGPAW